VSLIVAGIAVVVGLAFGSFLNVVIYRLPRAESLISPPSRCPRCGHTLTAPENVPVFSWLFLRGRCKACGQPIPVRYPLVELLTAALFLIAVLEFGASVQAVAVCVLAAFLVVVTFVDLDHLLIHDSLVIPAAVIGLIFAIVERRLLSAIEGGLVFAGLLGVLYLVTRGRGLGLGDVKMAGAIGLYLGYPVSFAAAIGAFVIGAVLAIPVLLAGSRGRREALPFGPFMVLSSLVGALAPALLFGPWAAYQAFLIDHVFRH
jgi:leader peptidase (prepilin peptidase) / N-methyltransferase